MKTTIRHWLRATLCAAALACGPASAEDIDLFAQGAPASAASRPNIIIMIDNSANWSAANQQWPGGIKQGEAELKALRRLLAEVNDNVNLGLMMFTPGSGSNPNGAYVRYAVRQMTAANRAAFQELIGDASCVNGPNSLNGTPNCILRNYDSSSEKVGSAKLDYSAGLFEAFKYFGGFTSPANAHNGVAGTPVSASQFGPLRYAGDPDSKSDPAAYVNGAGDPAKREYLSPINALNSCAQNVVIFIGNGFPSTDALPSLLSGVGGSTTQLLMPNPGGGFIKPSGNEIRYPDEWAKFLFSTDASPVDGRQGVAVYTIDAYNAQPDVKQNRLLMSMAKHGGGKYYAAKNEDAILNALREILIDVQSVNSVFTSASVPINATNRTQYENQVYIGMFRPDVDAKPRWHGNLKRFQVGFVNGELRLTDRNNASAIASSTGYLQSCAASYWTTDSGNYWEFSPAGAGLCAGNLSPYSDLPDGPAVEKGGAAEVIRRGNDPSVPNAPFTVNRTIYTCLSTGDCTSLVAFNTANVTAAALGAATAAEHQRIVDHTLGKDVNDENANALVTDSRPSLHGDVIHSQPLPVSYGGANGVVLYYGANDGTFRAVSGTTGRELWAFVAPEHHGRLKRLTDNSPTVEFPGMPGGVVPAPVRKDYFFDGTPALYQTANNSQVWVFPTMRRGGRMLYAFDVTNPSSPTLKWRVGCPNAANDTGCTSGLDMIGQTWSTPRVAKVLGYNTGNTPVIIIGGGYDACEDADSSNPSCSVAGVKGKRVFVLDASNGVVLATFTTERSVAADVSLVDRNGDGHVDHGYVADTGGNIYRIDFSLKTTLAPLAPNAWTITHIARTQNAGRKFLFAPAVVAAKDRVYVAIGSGDRERPLISQYPYVEDVRNRFYVFTDRFADAGAVDLDGPNLADFSAATSCTTTLGAGLHGWYMDLNNGRGEQTVTSPLIFGGLVYFSTNRAMPQTPGMCTANLGEARGYAVNLLNASGAVGTQAICGGARSGVFTGGGLPPSPVTATLPVDGKPVSVLFGGVHRSGGASSAIGAQQVKPSLSGKRTRMYWYTHGNK
ncbi:MAG TPA: PilC/PilY family type IV pilus protein [Burkholderiales bacterium]|nr:PilC/PilY family type IV pilus protein [Burkholderiales bacterium]